MCAAISPTQGTPVLSISKAESASESPSSTWILSDRMLNQQLSGSIGWAAAVAILATAHLPGHKEQDSVPNRLPPSLDLIASPSTSSPSTLSNQGSPVSAQYAEASQPSRLTSSSSCLGGAGGSLFWSCSGAPPSISSPVSTAAREHEDLLHHEQWNASALTHPSSRASDETSRKPMLPAEALIRIASPVARAHQPSGAAAEPAFVVPVAIFGANCNNTEDDNAKRRPARKNGSTVSFAPDADWLIFDPDQLASQPVTKKIPIRPPGVGDESPQVSGAVQTPKIVLPFEATQSNQNPMASHGLLRRSFLEASQAAATPKASKAIPVVRDFFAAPTEAKTPRHDASSSMGFDFETQSGDESDDSMFGPDSTSTSA